MSFEEKLTLVRSMKNFISPLLVAANVIGIFLYLRNASLSWAIPEEVGLNPAEAGPAMIWGLGALPIVMFFVVVDAIWFQMARRRNLPRLPIYLVLAAWVLAIVIDFAHH